MPKIRLPFDGALVATYQTNLTMPEGRCVCRLKPIEDALRRADAVVKVWLKAAQQPKGDGANVREL